MKEKILVLTCWGTIDKDYWSWKGVYDFHIWAPCVWSILDDLKIPKPLYECEELMRKDSLDMELLDREKIYRAVFSSQVEKILITHGTDTMIQTAQELQYITDKLIVIAGASRPYSMKVTDAAENIGFAWTELMTSTKKWVYIAMNQKFIPAHLAEKQDNGDFINILLD